MLTRLLEGSGTGIPYPPGPLVVPWKWFSAGVVEVSPSLDEATGGDVPPTSPRSLGASRCPKCPPPTLPARCPHWAVSIPAAPFCPPKALWVPSRGSAGPTDARPTEPRGSVKRTSTEPNVSKRKRAPVRVGGRCGMPARNRTTRPTVLCVHPWPPAHPVPVYRTQYTAGNTHNPRD